jgi:hypothetical protein
VQTPATPELSLVMSRWGGSSPLVGSLFSLDLQAKLVEERKGRGLTRPF